MDILGKLQPVIIIAAAFLGLALGTATPLGNLTSGAVEIFLMLLLYTLFLSIDLKRITDFFGNIKFTGMALTINFVVTPILGHVLGKLFFADAIDIRIGLLMLLVTPCTDWYLVFTGLSGGNVKLGMSILPLNLILQIVLMPVYLMLFVGREVNFDAASVLTSILLVLIIPFGLALITKRALKGKNVLEPFMEKQGDNLQLLFLCLAVVVMFASEGKNLVENPLIFLRLFVPLLIFFGVILMLAMASGRLAHMDKADTIALCFTTLARNSPLSLAIAVAAFPESPMISLALIIGPLIELPVLTVISGLLGRWRRK